MRDFLPAGLVLLVAACGARGSSVLPPPPAPPVMSWRDLDAGNAVAVDEPTPPPPPPPVEKVEAKRHVSSVLEETTPRASRLAAGTYSCRVDAMYKFRPCEVTKDARGFTHIAMPGSLTGLEGVVYDDGADLVIDGSSLDEHPFGCDIHMPEGARECLELPSLARLKKVGALWRGSVKHVTYYDHWEGVGPTRHVTSWDKEQQSFLVEIAPGPRH